MLQDPYDDLVKKFAAQLQYSIDNEIKCTLYVELGWTRVAASVDDPAPVLDWTKQNCKGKVVHLNDAWVFEDSADAAIFALRWP